MLKGLYTKVGIAGGRHSKLIFPLQKMGDGLNLIIRSLCRQPYLRLASHSWSYYVVDAKKDAGGITSARGQL